jgi:hypothetical protein
MIEGFINEQIPSKFIIIYIVIIDCKYNDITKIGPPYIYALYGFYEESSSLLKDHVAVLRLDVGHV